MGVDFSKQPNPTILPARHRTNPVVIQFVDYPAFRLLPGVPGVYVSVSETLTLWQLLQLIAGQKVALEKLSRLYELKSFKDIDVIRASVFVLNGPCQSYVSMNPFGVDIESRTVPANDFLIWGSLTESMLSEEYRKALNVPMPVIEIAVDRSRVAKFLDPSKDEKEPEAASKQG